MTIKHAFRSAPEFEERLCTSCQRNGDPDPYWPIDDDSWPRMHGKFVFHICKACKAESQRNSRNKKAANDERQAVAA